MKRLPVRRSDLMRTDSNDLLIPGTIMLPSRRCLSRLLLVLAVLVVWVVPGEMLSARSPEIPGARQKHPVALVGGTAHPVSGPPIQNATVLFEEGRLTAVAAGEIELPPDTERIDITGRHVYPGLIDAYTGLGLVEIGAVRATLDYAETGALNPNVRSQVAINPDSEHIPVARANGVLLALTAPSGGLVSGRSCVIQLDGWTFEDMTLLPDAGMHVRWPRMGPVSGPGASSESDLEALTDAFRRTRAYDRARSADPGSQGLDLRWEAMLPVLRREMPLVIQADDEAQIQAAVSFAREQDVRVILLGGYDAPRCADLLIENEIPVLVSGVYRLPQRRHAAYDEAYTLPERLRQAGISFAICSSASSRSSANVRNLPYHAATAAAYGLPADVALRSITLAPAEILGIADRVGSLEAGKDATLIVTDGDPLETPTHVVQAYIQGRPVQLTSRHTRLWEKYRERLERGVGTGE